MGAGFGLQERNEARNAMERRNGATRLRRARPATPQTQAAQATSSAAPGRAAGTDGRGRSDNDPIMCRCNRGDGAWASGGWRVSRKASAWRRISLAHAAARRLSDQDIMLRYRMTPPARGRPPGPAQRGALQPAPGRAEANGRGARFGWRARLPQRTWEISRQWVVGRGQKTAFVLC
jgi:hypothetical protein